MRVISKRRVKTRIVAFVAIFSALYMVLRLISTVPMVAVPGATFSLSDVVAPLYGVILGPYTGGLSVILGTFLAIGLGKPVSFMFLDFLPATINAVALGLLMKRKWMPVVILYAALLAAFLLNPLSLFLVQVPLGNGAFVFPFTWMHIAAFLVLVSPLCRKAVTWVETLKTANVTRGLAILVFIGTMMQHVTGSLLTEVIRGQLLGLIPAAAYPGIWTAVFFLYPWERLALILFAMLVGTPLVRTIKKSFPMEEK